VRANLARMRCLGRIRANHSKNCNEEMLGEAQPQPVAHQCARDGGSDNENRQGHLRQLPAIAAKQSPGYGPYPTDWTTRGIKRLSFLFKSCDAPQILAYPMRSLKVARLLEPAADYSNPCILVYRPRDKLMTSSRRQKLFRFLQPLRNPSMIGSVRGARRLLASEGERYSADNVGLVMDGFGSGLFPTGQKQDFPDCLKKTFHFRALQDSVPIIILGGWYLST